MSEIDAAIEQCMTEASKSGTSGIDGARACYSCLHLRRALDALAYLGELVPFPDFVDETQYYLAQLHGGHLATSHADSPPVSLLSTSASSENGVTGVHGPVTKIHPSELPNSD